MRGVYPSHARVFSCAHYFQAPATQARQKYAIFETRTPFPCEEGLTLSMTKLGSMLVVIHLP